MMPITNWVRGRKPRVAGIRICRFAPRVTGSMLRVRELSAINGVAGSYAEHVPVFHLAGMPPSRVQAARRVVHHTLGNGEFDLFYRIAEPVVCARAIMTPENCAAETERLIAAAALP